MAKKLDWERYSAKSKRSEADDEFMRPRNGPASAMLVIDVTPLMLGRISSGMRAKRVSVEGLARAIKRDPADVEMLVAGKVPLIRVGSLRGLYRALGFEDPEWWIEVDRQGLLKQRKQKEAMK